MAKIDSLEDVLSLINESTATGTLNANMDRIEEAFQNTLSRDGSVPNQMEYELDTNSNKIINVSDIRLPDGRSVADQLAASDLVAGIIADNGDFTPEAFGAAGDGTTDDTTSFQQCVDYCRTNSIAMSLREGSSYVLTDTIQFGETTNVVGFRGLWGNKANILPRFNNKPVFDLTGIQNGVRAFFRDIRSIMISGGDENYN